LLFRSYIKPPLLCLVTSAPEDAESMFLRNVGIDLYIHTAPKLKDFDNMIKIAVRTLGLNLTKMYIFRKVFKRMGNV
jgi:hypothetical protein